VGGNVIIVRAVRTVVAVIASLAVVVAVVALARVGTGTAGVQDSRVQREPLLASAVVVAPPAAPVVVTISAGHGFTARVKP
jgi:hypothetical protein